MLAQRPGSDTQALVIGTFTGRSQDEAKRKALAAIEKVGEQHPVWESLHGAGVTLVACPERSWKPETFKSEVQTSFAKVS